MLTCHVMVPSWSQSYYPVVQPDKRNCLRLLKHSAYACVCVCVCVYVCACACVSVCVCEREREREKGKERKREPNSCKLQLHYQRVAVIMVHLINAHCHAQIIVSSRLTKCGIN